ncbi:MCE family protein [Saccharopolyspora gloriosae]|uniref:Phospholipid/cholesterol/gamma-HCH transport system substrate-binding protein n=1 Tax=Saccharopolyspora gloriosae TaxID=455344 RepID=A0A840NBF2_9PSEU|nr:MlaD family protein [Saccharopolyspora gloriosae]MBB5069290.1 phospholipid/cholesterol/gamma-HCH transport system substrate-binding protein [Saccharopolyspora gloriosae]
MSRAVLIQLALFLVIALGCGAFVVDTVMGAEPARAPIRVAVRLPDAAGLAETSQVTYRGVRTGTVGAVDLDPSGEGVTLRLRLDPGSRVPADAVARISMDTPMAVQHLDLQPATDAPPYLRDGDVIRAEDTSAPMPLDTLLVHVTDLAESIDPHDVRVLSEAAATGLNGAGPELRRIMDNTRDLTRLAAEREPQLTNLIEQGPQVLGSVDEAGGLPRLASSMRELADEARTQEPAIRDLAGRVPGTTRAVSDLLARNEGAASALLGNLLITGEVLGDHVPALRETMTALPQGLSDLASIVHGDVADFYLVAAQGPACYYGTERRTPTETAPREPQLGWSCAPGPGLSQRGADSAPRPGSPVSAASEAAGPARYPAAPPGAQSASPDAGAASGVGGVLGPRPWSSIMFQGVR